MKDSKRLLNFCVFLIAMSILLTASTLAPFLLSTSGRSEATDGETSKRRAGSQDSDGDGVPDDVDILDNGNAVFIVSVDYINLDDSADFLSWGDPYFGLFIDIDDDREIDEDEGELWWSPMFEDTDEISDEGFEDGGILWHGIDIPDNMTFVYMEIAVFDDDNDGDYETMDISEDEDEVTLFGYFTIDEDGPLTERYSDDGSNDGNDGEMDAQIDYSFHVVKGTSIESVTPTSKEVTMSEGQILHLEIKDVFSPPYMSDTLVAYQWFLSFANDTENWYCLSNESTVFKPWYTLSAHYGSAGEYLIAGVAYTFFEGHDCYFWDVRIWNLTILHHNTVPKAVITVNSTIAEPFESISFSGWQSHDLDGDALKYEWDFGDGTTVEGADVTHTFINSKQYTDGLTVTDDEGASDTTSIDITVNPLDLSDAKFWRALENGDVVSFDTDYDSVAQNRVSKSINLPLISGYSLGVSASFVSETTVRHTGSVTYQFSIDENKDKVTIATELLGKEDYYEVYYRPFFEFNITIANDEGEWDTLWSTEAPVPIESNVDGLDADGEPLKAISVFSLGKIDIYTWDIPKKIYESSTPLENHTGSLVLDTKPITVVDVDILKFLEMVTGVYPPVSFGLKILDYFVNLFLQGNININLAIEDCVGILTRTTGALEGGKEVRLFDSSTSIQSQTIAGVNSETKMYGIMDAKVDASASLSLDFYFNLTECGQTTYGLWKSMGEKGFIVAISDAVGSFFSSGSLPKEDYSFRKTLWKSDEMLPMKSHDLYSWDYLSYTSTYSGEADNNTGTRSGEADEVGYVPGFEIFSVLLGLVVVVYLRGKREKRDEKKKDNYPSKKTPAATSTSVPSHI